MDSSNPRGAGLFGAYDTLLPELAFDPESYRTLGKERKRASRTIETKNTSEWKWGDEE